MTTPIWDRQNRPKPPTGSGGVGNKVDAVYYAWEHNRPRISRFTYVDPGLPWHIVGPIMPSQPRAYRTFADAYAAAHYAAVYYKAGTQ